MDETFEITQDGPTITVSPQQPVVNPEQFRHMLDEVKPRLIEGQAANVLFDMSQVEFLDSACAAGLISLLQTVKETGGRIVLVYCQPNVAFLLKMSKLDSLFDVVEDMAQARERLRDIA